MRIVLISVGILSLAASGGMVSAGADKCDLKNSSGNSSQSYKWRQNRCEGRFRTQVNADRVNLQIVGYHANKANYNVPKGKPLRLSSGYRGKTRPILFKFVSTRSRDFYQMDTRQVSPSGTFDWNMDVLRSIAPPIKTHNIAGYACASKCAGNSVHGATILPIRFPQSGKRPAVERAKLIVRADTGLEKLTMTIETEDGQTRQKSFVRVSPGDTVSYYLPQMDGAFADVKLHAVTDNGTQDLTLVRLALPNV